MSQKETEAELKLNTRYTATFTSLQPYAFLFGFSYSLKGFYFLGVGTFGCNHS